jgi:hypothetical protein
MLLDRSKLITAASQSTRKPEGKTAALRLVEVHCGTGYKNNLRELIAYKVPPVKGALVENGKITYITI